MPSSPRRRARLLPGGLGLLVLVALGACAGPVEVAIPAQAEAPACAAASEHWPAEILGEAPTQTEPSDPTVIAWADPAVIARCGMPALGPTENQCIVVDGIDWVAEDLGDGTKLTTFGREPAIEVLVPDEHGPAPLLLPAFSEAAEQLPTNDYSCS
ncbi:DUF3515 family protein [Janibacter sp. DB-40]|uniref:DUF3515 family protein n=1 Tax=Janibacter sp. DB-40 TaxID=3028808 RepID=UPI0024067173|nr:DUF3515 family protein [Janibacter sp. DB-40]